jgi:4-hydroxybenzoate polyprenyltransferase
MALLWVPERTIPYLRLMRAHRLANALLPILPVCWGLLLAVGKGFPSWKVVLLFCVACAVMDMAGTVANDIVDRDIDKMVTRTASRPLAAGDLSLRQAVTCLVALVLTSFLVLAPLGIAPVLMLAGIWLPVAAYPFMKRISSLPQAWLALTYNLFVPVAWVTQAKSISVVCLLLYMSSVFWTLAYDTIYAHQDKHDDARIGIGSSALLFGSHTSRWLMLFYGGNLVLLAVAGGLSQLEWPFYAVLLGAACHAAWQIRTVDFDDAEDCDRKFSSNSLYGTIVLVAILVGHPGGWY